MTRRVITNVMEIIGMKMINSLIPMVTRVRNRDTIITIMEGKVEVTLATVLSIRVNTNMDGTIASSMHTVKSMMLRLARNSLTRKPTIIMLGIVMCTWVNKALLTEAVIVMAEVEDIMEAEDTMEAEATMVAEAEEEEDMIKAVVVADVELLMLDMPTIKATMMDTG